MRFLAVTMSILFIALAFACLWRYRCKSFVDNTIIHGEYTVDKGERYSSVRSKIFGEMSVPFGFDTYLIRVLKTDRTLHYGYYKADNISLSELLGNISLGKQTLQKVTIPEGYNMYDVAKTIEKAGISSADALIKVFKDREAALKLTGKAYESLEGFLSPGTYFFAREYPPDKIAATLVGEFFKSLPKDFENLVKVNGLSFYDALILASIVQKETYSAEESPLVAAVFINRLKKRMRLQADPTIIYGKYEIFNGNISKKDLQDAANRFNTYAHYGLPPTPIANPSAMALSAVAHPQNTKYLYFVATIEGVHIFSETYAEHQKNVDFHQRHKN